MMKTASKPACLSFVAKGPPTLASPQPSVNGDLVTIEQRVAPGTKPTEQAGGKAEDVGGTEGVHPG